MEELFIPYSIMKFLCRHQCLKRQAVHYFDSRVSNWLLLKVIKFLPKASSDNKIKFIVSNLNKMGTSRHTNASPILLIVS